jgi:hypothetical protein
MKGIRDEGWKDCECGHGLLIVPLVMHFTASWSSLFTLLPARAQIHG